MLGCARPRAETLFMRMRQSINELEEAFHEQMALDRKRREQLRRRAALRARVRRKQRTEKHGKIRFSVLVVALTATVVIVSVAMFQILTWIMG